MTNEERIALLRQWRKAGITLATCGKRLGITRQWAMVLCHRHGITDGRYRQRAVPGDRHEEYKASLVPRSLDPEKAQQITDAKRRYWGIAS